MGADVMTLTPDGSISLSERALESLGAAPGSRLVGYVHGNILVLQVEPETHDYAQLLDEAAAWAETVGLRESDIEDAIREFRAERRLAAV